MIVSWNQFRISTFLNQERLNDMYTRPMIFPFDSTGRIYVLQDEKGQVVGTGSREVCETLMYLISAGLSPTQENTPLIAHNNVRAAITI